MSREELTLPTGLRLNCSTTDAHQLPLEVDSGVERPLLRGAAPGQEQSLERGRQFVREPAFAELEASWRSRTTFCHPLSLREA